MARINFGIDTRMAPHIYDRAEEDPAYGGRRHVWVELADLAGSELILKLGYGLLTDAEIVASAHVMVTAFGELMAAAQARIAAAAVSLGLVEAGAVAGLSPDAGDHYARATAAGS